MECNDGSEISSRFYCGSEESLLNCQTYTRLFDQWDAGLRDDVTIFLDLVDLKFLGLVQRQ